MNSHLYLPRSRDIDYKINKLISRYGLKLSYNEKKEKIYKNEDVIVSLNRSYILLYALSNKKDFLKDIHRCLKGGCTNEE